MSDTVSPMYPAVRRHGARHVIGTALLVLLVLFAVPCLLVTAFMLKMFVEDMRTYAQLRQRGERVEAVISGRRIDEDDSGTIYLLTYRFRAGEEIYEREFEAFPYEYKRYAEAATLPVLYLPDDPKTSMTEMELKRENLANWVVLVVVPLVLMGIPGGLLLGWWWIFRRNGARLRKHGVSVKAAIIDVRRDEPQAPQRFTFVFNATHPDGTVEPISGQERLPVNMIDFKIGEYLDVRYLPHNPRIFMIEPDSLVKAASGGEL